MEDGAGWGWPGPASRRTLTLIPRAHDKPPRCAAPRLLIVRGRFVSSPCGRHLGSRQLVDPRLVTASSIPRFDESDGGRLAVLRSLKTSDPAAVRCQQRPGAATCRLSASETPSSTDSDTTDRPAATTSRTLRRNSGGYRYGMKPLLFAGQHTTNSISRLRKTGVSPSFPDDRNPSNRPTNPRTSPTHNLYRPETDPPNPFTHPSTALEPHHQPIGGLRLRPRIARFAMWRGRLGGRRTGLRRCCGGRSPRGRDGRRRS